MGFFSREANFKPAFLTSSVYVCSHVEWSRAQRSRTTSTISRCLWAAIWWMSLRCSLREPFSLRRNNFVLKLTSSPSPLCSSDPAPSSTSEITQCIIGPRRTAKSGDGNLNNPGRPKQSQSHGLCVSLLVKNPSSTCLALLRASRCGLIYCDSANCCN